MPRPCSSSVIGVAVFLALPFLCACHRSEGGETAPTRSAAEPPRGGAPSAARYEPEARSLGISGRYPLFARGRNDGTILVREESDGQRQRTLAGHGKAVTSLSFSPDGAYLASGFQDGTVRLWDPRSGREVATRRDHTTPVDSFLFSHDGSRLASVGRDWRLIVYDVPGARIPHDLTSLADQVHATRWIWAIAPVKENEPSPASGRPEAVAEVQKASAVGETRLRSVGSLLGLSTAEVIFRPARVRVETEYVERSVLRRVPESSLLLHDEALLREVSPQSARELVVAVTLSLEPSAGLRDARLDTISFRLSPCAAAGDPCSAPELALGAPRQSLVGGERSQSLLVRKVIAAAEPPEAGQDSLLTTRPERLSHAAPKSWSSFSYHLPLLELSSSFGTPQTRFLHELVRSPRESWAMSLLEQAQTEQAFVAFSRDSSVVSWASPTGLIHVVDLLSQRHLTVFPFVEGLGRGEWRARFLELKRVKNFSSSWSKWEIQNPDWSFLLVKVFLENHLPRESFLPLSGVYVSSDGALYPAVGVMDLGIHKRDSRAGVAMRGKGEGAQIFVFVVPHSVKDGLKLHILDLVPIELVD